MAIKTRARGKGGSKYGRMDRRDEFVAVREGAARLQVNLFDHLDTGLFLDHRPVRRRLGAEARGQRMLNLFCYTGAASVQAAAAPPPPASTSRAITSNGPHATWR